MNKEPLVSIIVLTYNHEQFIRQSLDSILMQEVSFQYEIIIGDDCSPDNTSLILKEYEEKYPELIEVIYRKKNIGGRKNLLDLFKRCRGQYIAQLEGDDFWTASNKLDQQIKFLEANKEFIATAHKTKIVDKYGNLVKDKRYPECTASEYTWKHYKKNIVPGQSASIVMRNFLKEKIFNLDLYMQMPTNLPSDRITFFLLLSYGKIYCFSEAMSAYRYITNEGTSYSARIKRDNKKYLVSEEVMYNNLYSYTTQKNSKNINALKTIESMFFWFLCVNYLRNRNKSDRNRLMSEFSKLKYKKDAIRYLLFKVGSIPIRRLKRQRGLIGA